MGSAADGMLGVRVSLSLDLFVIAERELLIKCPGRFYLLVLGSDSTCE